MKGYIVKTDSVHTIKDTYSRDKVIVKHLLYGLQKKKEFVKGCDLAVFYFDW